MNQDNEFNNKFQEYEKQFAEERKKFFLSLSKEQQLLVFCEVVSKLYQAEIIDKRSYRGVLYSEFGFDKNAYLAAQISNFLELHNSIDASMFENENKFLEKFLATYGIYTTKEDIESKMLKLKSQEKEEPIINIKLKNSI